MSEPKATSDGAPYRRTKVFISYRRDVNAGDAERLYDELKRYFPPRHLFLDVKSIGRGDSFPVAIETALASCGALLALIGPRWLGASDGHGRRRLDDPSDMVRREVSAALTRGTWLIPILTHGAAMPRAEDLPDDLKRLAEFQAVEIRSGHWEKDVRELVTLLKRRLYRRRRLAAALSLAAALAIVAALSYHFATVATPVDLTPDGKVKIPSVRYHDKEENAQALDGGAGPQELVVEGLAATSGEIFTFDGKPVTEIRVDFDSARFQEGTVKILNLDPEWGEDWHTIWYSSGSDEPNRKRDFDQACSTSAAVAAADLSAPPTSLRLFQVDPPAREEYRAISLSADRDLAVSLDLKAGTRPADGPSCSKQVRIDGGKPKPYVGYSAALLAGADAPISFQFIPLDQERTSPRTELFRLSEDGSFDLRMTSLRARRVAVRARDSEEIGCGDKLSHAPTLYFEASSADGRSSLRLQKLKIGADYFSLSAEGEAYVVSQCVPESPDITQRVRLNPFRAAFLLASAIGLSIGLVYYVAML